MSDVPTGGGQQFQPSGPPPPVAETRIGTVLFEGPAPKPPREPWVRTDIKASWVVAALALGVLSDIAIRRAPWNNVAASLLVIGSAIALVQVGIAKTQTSRLLVLGASMFGLALTWRSDPRLMVANMVVIGSLFLASVLNSRGVRLSDMGPTQAIDAVTRMFGLVFANLGDAPREIAVRSSSDDTEGNGFGGVVRGVALAVPLILVLGTLLASADTIFASIFGSVFSNVGPSIGHLIVIALGALLFSAVLRYSFGGEPAIARPFSGPRLGKVEATVILGCVNALFTVFAIAQVWARSSSGEAILANSQLQYKDYARQGFFQLLWVAAITLVVLVAIRTAAQAMASNSKTITNLSLGTVALTLVIVGVACYRLSLYIVDNGLTPLRFYSFAFALWIGVAFLVVGLWTTGVAAHKSWLTAALLATGIVAVAALNLVGPESLIAANNVERPSSTAVTFHVNSLSGDGVAHLANNIDSFDPKVQARLTDRLCDIKADRFGEDFEKRDIFGYNFGDAKANESLEVLCAN